MLEPTVTLAHTPRHRTSDPTSDTREYGLTGLFEATPVSAHDTSAGLLASDQDRVITHWLRTAEPRLEALVQTDNRAETTSAGATEK